MSSVAQRAVTLQFDPDRLAVGDDAVDLREGLSAVVVRDNQLWVACDEGCRLERLTRTGTDTFGLHTTFDLQTLLTLPAAATEEADVEGLDVSGGFLWLVGSHSVKRKKAKLGDAPADVAKKLGTLSRDGNRHLCGRWSRRSRLRRVRRLSLRRHGSPPLMATCRRCSSASRGSSR
jgi:hypothetical protein